MTLFDDDGQLRKFEHQYDVDTVIGFTVVGAILGFVIGAIVSLWRWRILGGAIVGLITYFVVGGVATVAAILLDEPKVVLLSKRYGYFWILP